MLKDKPAELSPSKEKDSKLAFLHRCLKFVGVLTKLFNGINACWTAIKSVLDLLP